MNTVKKINPIYFHVDLDAFFASVEQLDHPEYRGKPLVVGGLPGDRRAVVSTASYEARKYGIHSAMPLSKAVQLCPHAIFVRHNGERYEEKSAQVMKIFTSYSPDVRQISIDEAFLDMTGTERLMGEPVKIAETLKKEVKENTGLTVSVGIASTMFVAKIASGYNKPDGLTYIPYGFEENFILSLPLEKLWGVGTKTREHLKKSGINTIKEIHSLPLSSLKAMFGENTGDFLYNAVRGNKGLMFGEEAKSHSISAEETYEYDLTDMYTMETALMKLCENVLYRMHIENVSSRTVSIKVRYEDFTTFTAQETSDLQIKTEDDFFERAVKLFRKKYEKGRGIRLLGISVMNTEDKNLPQQGELFNSENIKKAKIEKAIFSLQDKNPGMKIRKARTLKDSGKKKTFPTSVKD